jgi:putative mRNA 3-end processing factor
MPQGLVVQDPNGLFCRVGNFYIDPWEPVDYAVITHAHSDHARWGSRNYLCAKPCHTLLSLRLGEGAKIESIPFGEKLVRNGVTVSFHPAGHILGSAQVRVEFQGEVWVISGDYKLQGDSTCHPFEPIQCHTFVSECTFGLPIYRWPDSSEVFEEINAWWKSNQEKNRTSILFCYPLGKAQRLLSGLEPSLGPIFVHGSIQRLLPAYEQEGIRLPKVEHAITDNVRGLKGKGIVVAPVSSDNTPWLRKMGEVSTAFASGWMQIRGTRRRRALDRGFVLSDHVDWPDLLRAIQETGADTVWATHGYTSVLVRWLREHGYSSELVRTKYEGELAVSEGGEHDW